MGWETTNEGRKPGDQPNHDEVPKIQPIKRPLTVTALSLAGLFILALCYTLYFGRAFFLPVAFATILALLFRPIVAGLARLHIPEVLGAAGVVIGLVSTLALALFLLGDPANRWLQNAPAHLAEIEDKLRELARPAEKITEAAATVEKLTRDTSDGIPEVEIKKPGLLNVLWLQTRDAGYIFAEVVILLFFFLAVGDSFLLKLIQILPRLQDKKRAVEIARETQKGVSQYLGTMTLINLYEGVAIGTGLWLLGLPNPLLWGALAFFANFIPYLGALLAGSAVTIAALVSLDSSAKALIAPAIYFGVNFTDNFIAPYIFGRRLILNPVVVFLAVMFWGWIWGLAGVLMAVPITMTIKILGENIPALAPFAEFLSGPRHENPEPREVLKPAPVKGNA